MDLSHIRKAVDRRPYKPFDVRLSDGSVFTVTHPEFIGMAPGVVFIGQPDGNYELVNPDQIVALSMRRNGGIRHARR